MGNIIKLEYHHQSLGCVWFFAMGFNEEIIALTSFFKEEIRALTVRCRQNKIQKLFCFMKNEVQVSYTGTYLSLRLMGSDTRHLASYVESGSVYLYCI